ncbi:hypothetical protein [Calothrix sp. PCC 7507]|uniref:hypothetical protein n=1 Tax=Calothrix sp. PCC 7507 TaxID=99598 RepID=UPI00029EC5F3|nr:hypothetical protein [Calothrix sp. PCC 7507]AFY32387.1 hypothetical protein Cal7507_1938 [Calothrix sp. PCC 7507]
MVVKLGFGSVPKPQYVFVSRESDHCWYMLADDAQHIPIFDKALTGVIAEIEANKIVETKFGSVRKTDLHISADKPYIIRSGSDSFFSKNLLLCLDALSDQELCKPLTIAVSPGDSNVVFCKIYDPITYRSIGVSWDGYQEIDWQALGQKVSLKINGINHFNQAETNISTNSITAEIRDVFIAQTDTYLAQLNWSPNQGKEYLLQRYGKRSRLQLTDIELLEFIDYLKRQVNQS